MYLPVPGFQSTSSVFLGEFVTHWATVADNIDCCTIYYMPFWAHIKDENKHLKFHLSLSIPTSLPELSHINTENDKLNMT